MTTWVDSKLFVFSDPLMSECLIYQLKGGRTMVLFRICIRWRLFVFDSVSIDWSPG